MQDQGHRPTYCYLSVCAIGLITQERKDIKISNLVHMLYMAPASRDTVLMLHDQRSRSWGQNIVLYPSHELAYLKFETVYHLRSRLRSLDLTFKRFKRGPKTYMFTLVQCLKWKIRAEGIVRQLWAPKQVVLAPGRFFMKFEMWERWISIIVGAGTAFPCV